MEKLLFYHFYRVFFFYVLIGVNAGHSHLKLVELRLMKHGPASLVAFFFLLFLFLYELVVNDRLL